MMEARSWCAAFAMLACVALVACSADAPEYAGSASGGQGIMQPMAGMTAGTVGDTTPMPVAPTTTAPVAPAAPGGVPGASPDASPSAPAPDTTPAAPAGPPAFPGAMPPAPDDGAPMFPGPMPSADPAPAPSEAPTTTPAPGTADISSCAPPPDDASATAVEAWTLLNEIRLAAGSTCINMHPLLNTAAQLHCDYRAANRGNSGCGTSAHTEVPGCEGFTGDTVQAREIAAGYPRNLAYTEVALTYGDNPKLAIPGWLVTPFHRIPMLDPWTTDMGWGGAAGCDVIDFGRGTDDVSDDAVVIFPYDGQVDVPPTFNGLEAPMPPMPDGGWPSSYPISIYAKRMNITEHVLTKDGDDTPLDHLWLDARSPQVSAGLKGYFTTTALMYGAPFEANTTYRVKLVGTYQGGDLNLDWTFTTGDAPRSPWGF